MRILDRTADLEARPVWGGPITESDLAQWAFYVPARPASRGAAGVGVSLAPLAQSRYAIRTRAFDAAGVDALRLRFGQPIAGQVELYWNAAGEDFAPQRYLLASPDVGDPRQVTFDLSAQRAWRGPVARLGVRLLPLPARGQELESIEGLRLVPRRGLEDGAIRRVPLAEASLPAWIARSRSVIERTLRVPRKARLRLSAAPWLSQAGTARLRIVAATESGQTVLAETELQQAAEPEQGQWKPIEVDLSRFADQEVKLRFEAGDLAADSLLLWGNPVLVAATRDARPNVVLISLDTVRADHLSVYGYARPTTPRLAAWSARWATVFETAVASAPWTLPSHVAMLTGLDAVHHGVNRHGPVPVDLPLLPQRFAEAGYSTFATTAGVLLTPELGFARGFDEFRIRGRMESLPEWDAELGRGVDEAVGWISHHRDDRFFVFFHTYEAHAPYQAREPFFSELGGRRELLNAGAPVWMEDLGFEAWVRPRYGLFNPTEYEGEREYPKRMLTEADRALVDALYDSGLAYIDLQVGRLLEFLAGEGLLDRTVVVITSDHGESLYEHGLVGHSSLYDHDLLVPLIVAAPVAGSRGLRVVPQVRSVDIAPTLAELAALPASGEVDGLSLVPFLRGKEAPPRDASSFALSTTRGVAMRFGGRRLKVIAQDTVFEPFRGALEVYDLERDPAELDNRAGAAAQLLGERVAEQVRPRRGSIELRVRNEGTEPFSGMFAGPGIDNMITSADLRSSCCRHDPDGVRFDAPAGCSYTIRLHDQHRDAITFYLFARGRQWSVKLSGSQVSEGVSVDSSGGRWQVVPIGSASGPRIGIDVVTAGALSSAATDDAAILKALRALGYVR